MWMRSTILGLLGRTGCSPVRLIKEPLFKKPRRSAVISYPCLAAEELEWLDVDPVAPDEGGDECELVLQ